MILVVDFDGTTFEIVGKHTASGTSPNWLVFKDPGWVLANDENSDTLRLFRVGSSPGQTLRFMKLPWWSLID